MTTKTQTKKASTLTVKPAPTPGPWNHYVGHPTDPEISIGTPEQYAIAKVPIGYGDAARAQAVADARLIAAAPTLLACLQTMAVGIAMGNEPRHWDTDKTQKMLQDAIRKALA